MGQGIGAGISPLTDPHWKPKPMYQPRVDSDFPPMREPQPDRYPPSYGEVYNMLQFDPARKPSREYSWAIHTTHLVLELKYPGQAKLYTRFPE